MREMKKIRSMKSLPKFKSVINHFFGLGDNFGATGETSEIITDVTIITLNRNSMLFTNNVPRAGQNFGKSIPRVCVKNAIFEMFHFFV